MSSNSRKGEKGDAGTKKKKRRKRRSSISETQISELEKNFSYLQQKKDGKISKTELEDMMKRIGEHSSGSEAPSAEDVEDILGQIDWDQEGYADFEGFVGLMRENNKEILIQEAFDMFDSKGTGMLSCVQLRDALKNLVGEELSVEEVKEMTGSDEIDFEKFKKLMMN